VPIGAFKPMASGHENNDHQAAALFVLPPRHQRVQRPCSSASPLVPWWWAFSFWWVSWPLPPNNANSPPISKAGLTTGYHQHSLKSYFIHFFIFTPFSLLRFFNSSLKLFLFFRCRSPTVPTADWPSCRPTQTSPWSRSPSPAAAYATTPPHHHTTTPPQ